MSLLPIFVIFGMAWLGIRAGRSSRTSMGAERPTHHESVRESDPIETLAEIERSRQVPASWLVAKAVRQAYERGDWRIALAIADRYPHAYEISGGRPSEPAKPSDTAAEADKASPPADVPPSLPQHLTSPIEGLRDEDWYSFVEVMCCDPIGAKTDSHVGCFHHRVDRLKVLRIDPDTLQDFGSQYDAFVRECVETLKKHERIFMSALALPVNIKGQSHPVTASGMLALFKAAGPKNAMVWINDGKQQEKFPHTTELFIRANGIF